MKTPNLSRQTLFKAAENACQAHPRDAAAAHRVFLDILAGHGVRTRRLPEIVFLSIQGAIDRSVGDAKAAAWRIQSDLGPMMEFLGLSSSRSSHPDLPLAA